MHYTSGFSNYTDFSHKTTVISCILQWFLWLGNGDCRFMDNPFKLVDELSLIFSDVVNYGICRVKYIFNKWARRKRIKGCIILMSHLYLKLEFEKDYCFSWESTLLSTFFFSILQGPNGVADVSVYGQLLALYIINNDL